MSSFNQFRFVSCLSALFFLCYKVSSAVKTFYYRVTPEETLSEIDYPVIRLSMNMSANIKFLSCPYVSQFSSRNW